MAAPTQEIRFVDIPDGRIAVGRVGTGPPLVLTSAWMSNLEQEWEFPEYRSFVTSLARSYTVIRYDRLGVGMSQPGPAGAHADVSVESERLHQVLTALDLERVALLGISWGGCVAVAFAAAFPERVRALVTSGTMVDGGDVAPAALRSAIVDLVRAHWGAGARVLTDIWIPGADQEVRERFARGQRACAEAEVAAAALEAVYATRIGALLPRVQAPTLVTHRRDDRATPVQAGRELAAAITGATFVPLDGAVHLPWLGDTGQVLDVVLPFLREHAGPDSPARVLLSEREREVLRLVADGLGDVEIARRLFLSPYTVHRHLANIRAKLGQSSRWDSVDQARRLGLI